jgi:hypothetical protein
MTTGAGALAAFAGVLFFAYGATRSWWGDSVEAAGLRAHWVQAALGGTAAALLCAACVLIVLGGLVVSSSRGRTGVILVGVGVVLATAIKLYSLGIDRPEFDGNALMVPWLGAVLCELVVVVGAIVAIVDVFSNGRASRVLGIVSVGALGVALCAQGNEVLSGPALALLGIAVLIAPSRRHASIPEVPPEPVVPHTAGNLAD